MSATKDERTVLLYKICSLQRKKLNLLYEDIRSVHENDGTNVEGLWGNGVWGMW